MVSVQVLNKTINSLEYLLNLNKRISMTQFKKGQCQFFSKLSYNTLFTLNL